MGNRTGNYIAFDGLGRKDPTQSDFKYYATLQAWAANKNIFFNITNSHEKASSVRDTSAEETLKKSIRQRLAVSKNMLIILSKNTRKTGSMLSYEIEKAVDLYQLPLIIAYVDYDRVTRPKELSNYWPVSLKTRINNSTAKAIHIGFTKELILSCLSRFTVNGEQLNASLHYFE